MREYYWLTVGGSFLDEVQRVCQEDYTPTPGMFDMCRYRLH
jgi:hypothetical protein